MGIGFVPDTLADGYLSHFLAASRLADWFTPPQIGSEAKVTAVIQASLARLDRSRPSAMPIHSAWFAICPSAWDGNLALPPT